MIQHGSAVQKINTVHSSKNVEGFVHARGGTCNVADIRLRSEDAQNQGFSACAKQLLQICKTKMFSDGDTIPTCDGPHRETTPGFYRDGRQENPRYSARFGDPKSHDLPIWIASSLELQHGRKEVNQRRTVTHRRNPARHKQRNHTQTGKQKRLRRERKETKDCLCSCFFRGTQWLTPPFRNHGGWLAQTPFAESPISTDFCMFLQRDKQSSTSCTVIWPHVHRTRTAESSFQTVAMCRVWGRTHN